MKNIAVIFSKAPHGSANSREALDASLAASDINHVSVFFIDDGVLNLLPNQNPDSILQRDYIATFKMLALYDINDVYACQKSLEDKNLQQADLIIDVKKLAPIDYANLLRKQDIILRF